MKEFIRLNIKVFRLFIFMISSILFFYSCAPVVKTKISKVQSNKYSKTDVKLIAANDPVPANTIEIGTVKIGDSGFTANCSMTDAVDLAKDEAAKAGGNVIQIIEHKKPNMGSSCHRIKAKILKIDNISQLEYLNVPSDSNLHNANYALIHVFRHHGPGFLISYNLHLDDMILCRVSNNWKATVKVETMGNKVIWAKTEAKDEIPITIEPGKEYYVRCSLKMGVMVGQPKLELVPNDVGRFELQSIR